ncbi:hypothetical protein K3495_g4160 [Podosphaera aphanis]|nr:hypothetical protein K3495_g4160 [Podosphaera aphanis]
MARTQLEASNKAIDALEEQANQLNVNLSIARVGHTHAATTSGAAAPIDTPPLRSGYFSDPEKFNGGRNKLPGFITQLRMKLEVNQDCFRSKSLNPCV